MNKFIIVLVLIIPMFFALANPVDLQNTTGNFWINHTWEAGLGNLTDSYNVSINGVWHNETIITYYNNTDLEPHGWSNITVFAFNNSGSGGFGESGISQDTQVPNNAPIAVGDSYNVNEDSVLNIIAPGVLDNDNDLDSDPLNTVLVDNTTNGTLTLNENGSFSYTPNSNFNGADSFTYKANDGYDDSNIAIVSITVKPVNDAPVAVDNSYSVSENSDLNIVIPGVLGNDDDLDNDQLNAVLVESTTNGTLNLNENGSFSYTPNSNFNGADSFTYRANDGYDDSNIATVEITVDSINDAPVAVGDSYSVSENSDLNVVIPGVLGNDNDLENDQLNAVLVDSTTNGTLNLNENGSFSYTPNSNFNGVDSFTYKTNDGYDDSNIVTVLITVNTDKTPTSTDIPEFPTIALPVISVIGLMFLMQRRKDE